MSKFPKTDAAQIITNIILEKLEAGTQPWVRPWTGMDIRPRRHEGSLYTGINAIFLGVIADAHGYTSPFWMTVNQANQLGAQVRKGEHGSFSVYYSRGKSRERNIDTGEVSEKGFSFLKSYHVFNASQIDGLPEHYHPEPPMIAPDPVERRAELRAFYEAVPILVRHGGNSAYYQPSTDMVVIPNPGAFRDLDYYSTTRFHELIHATGSRTRLDRQFGKRFGDDAYAFEELVACMGQSQLCNEFGLPHELHDQHASYIASWVKVLKGDKTAIIHAAAKAEQAVKWLRDSAKQASDGNQQDDQAEAA